MQTHGLQFPTPPSLAPAGANAPVAANNLLGMTDQDMENGLAIAIRALLTLIPESTELLFYRDRGQPARLEIQYPDGAVVNAVACEETANGLAQAFQAMDASLRPAPLPFEWETEGPAEDGGQAWVEQRFDFFILYQPKNAETQYREHEVAPYQAIWVENNMDFFPDFAAAEAWCREQIEAWIRERVTLVSAEGSPS